MAEPVRWVLIEGIIALFGAGLLYVLIGASFKFFGSTAPFAWREALDSMGWLYGTMIISIQSADRFFNSVEPSPYLAWACVAVVVVCGILLYTNMYLRGATPGYSPPDSAKIFVFVFAVVILAVGYKARTMEQKPPLDNVADTRVSKDPRGGNRG